LTSALSPLSLHDALPICAQELERGLVVRLGHRHFELSQLFRQAQELPPAAARRRVRAHGIGEAEESDLVALRDRDVGEHQRRIRSEEHTSELQSLAYLVC